MITFSDLTYAGAFRLPQTDAANTGRFYPNRGGISVASNPGVMYVQGYMSNGNIGWGEVAIPSISPDVTDRKELNVATAISPMIDIEGNVDTHGDKKDRAMHCYEYNGKLIGSLIQQYDASRDNKYFMWVADDAGVRGLYELDSRYLSAGWMGKMPEKWRELGDYYMGHAHTFSIVGRASSGPSFYGIDMAQFDDVVEPIQTTEYLCYANERRHGLHVSMYPEKEQEYGYEALHYNQQYKTDNPDKPGPEWADYPNQTPTVGNDVWTMLSRVGVGFVAGDTYVCIGSSAGHEHGLGYRIKNDQGVQSSGPAAYVQGDTSQFYWLYDMNDLLRVKRGEIASHEVLPYEYGPFKTPVTNTTWYKGQEGRNPVIGGSYDPVNSRVYISLRSADGNKPVVVAYDVPVDGTIPAPTDPVKDALSDVYTALDRLKGLL